MIVVRLGVSDQSALRRLAECHRWFMGPKMYSDIRKGDVTIEAVERHAVRTHDVEVKVDPFIPAGFILGEEATDRLRLVLDSGPMTYRELIDWKVRFGIDAMPEGDVRSRS